MCESIQMRFVNISHPLKISGDLLKSNILLKYFFLNNQQSKHYFSIKMQNTCNTINPIIKNNETNHKPGRDLLGLHTFAREETVINILFSNLTWDKRQPNGQWQSLNIFLFKFQNLHQIWSTYTHSQDNKAVKRRHNLTVIQTSFWPFFYIAGHNSSHYFV